MNIAGIICEYNPFHMGHMYQIERIRALLGDDTAVVCAMSGNFTQRGEPAVFEKHARAEAAVRCGADLVIELPYNCTVASAERFARGGVETLSALGICTHLSFGSECGDITALEKTAQCVMSHDMDVLIKKHLRAGDTYAAARQRAAYELLGEGAAVLEKPNNTLAVEYIKALRDTRSPIKALTVKREGDAHDTGECSGKALRELLLSGGEPWSVIPLPAAQVFKREIAAGRGPVGLEDMEAAIMAQLRRREDFSDVPDASEGLDMRMKRLARTAPTVQELIDAVKTKRYTRSRISRMVMCAYLGITQSQVKRPPEYISVLAMNERGMELLRLAAEHISLPLITKPASAKRLDERGRRAFEQQAMGTDLYTLAYPARAQRYGGQEWTRGPVIVKKDP